ncbi:MAG: amylo-alpha-1,6-glucosidase [Bdellovibrionota bacterium]
MHDDFDQLLPLLETEWLVADRQGLFAMGTASGTRTRKYHSFLSSIAGRLETNFLAHLDLICNDQGLWTHAYSSENHFVHHPEGYKHLTGFKAEPFPEWSWSLEDGKLSALLTPQDSGGFELALLWRGKRPANILVRPLWAMRALHELGSKHAELYKRPSGYEFRTPETGASVWIHCSDSRLEWIENETWYRGFFYQEEKERGYDATEDLFCKGHFALNLPDEKQVSFRFDLKPDAAPLKSPSPRTKEKDALQSYVLNNPPGLVAGFPWFGEWGRDTFIALPGIAAGLMEKTSSSKEARGVAEWTFGVLERWGNWILTHHMLPNLISKNGPQWNSADATLWWIHSLSSLWVFGRTDNKFKLFNQIKDRFVGLLSSAIEAIANGRHRHLKVNPAGLVEVLTPHSTWMDAQVDECAVTPRTGLLPEINALWVQAAALEAIWLGRPLARWIPKAALEMPQESNRPNIVFLHSIPFAPSLLIHDRKSMERDASLLRNAFWTPVGLRTLAPGSPDYIAIYEGPHSKRDRCYHQGPAWGWLKGHFDMADERFDRFEIVESQSRRNTSKNDSQRRLSTIEGHVAELYDAEPPWRPRGAPAQAWSLACAEEARLRVQYKFDQHLSQLLQEIP